MLEKLERLILRYDFYGPLLTERQQQAMQLHYENDLSLTEVAEVMGISRQGVFDLLKRSEKVLEAYEEHLGLVKKFEEDQAKILEAIHLLKSVEKKGLPEVEKAIQVLEEVLEAEILDEALGYAGGS